MFKVFTTADVIDRMVESLGEHACPWLDILERQGDIFYTGRNEDWQSNPEDPWFVVSQSGHDFINCEEYIDAIPQCPELVLKHPDSAFLLDIDEEFARSIERAYGVICQPASMLDHFCKVAESYAPWTLRKREFSDKSIDVERKCWKDLLGQLAPNCPSNALIVIDRNFFSDFNTRTQEYVGIEGLADFLDTILPKRLECDYQVLIVYEGGNFALNQYHQVSCSSGDDFNDVMTKYMNEKFMEIRKYPILVELLAASRYSYDYRYKQLFLETHNRRIATNYYYLGAELSLAPFWKGMGPRVSQKVWCEFLYSDYQRRSVCDLAVREIKDIEELGRRFVQAGDSYSSVSRPIRNRLLNSERLADGGLSA